MLEIYPSLEDAPRLGRSEEVYSDQIKTLIENKEYTMWEIANILKSSKSSIENHLHQLAYVIALMFVLHTRGEKNLLDCISKCNSLLKCNKNIPFLNKL